METQNVWSTDEFDKISKFSGVTSISDYFIYLSKGIDRYDPTGGEPFEFPIFWAMIQILIALLVAAYPTNDLHGYARNVFLRASDKNIWWYAKISWTVLSVLSFYVIAFVVVVGFALVVGDSTIFPASDVSLYVSGVDAYAISPPDIALALGVGVFASILLAVAQVVLSFMIKPVFSFVAVMAYLIAGTFFHVPILMADYSMLLRNGSLLGDGLSSISMVLICIVVTFVLSVGGGLYFKKRDII